ncbi:MAG: hypothetical protein WC641_06780, partial [Patescibacteria group bacterium]
MPNATYSIKFSIYTTESGGTPIWTAKGTTAVPTAMSITTTSGLFSVLLGDTATQGQNALNIDWNQDALYLGVTVGADAEMTPRKRLSSVPFAFNAQTLQGNYASSSVAATGGSLFSLHQTTSDAASATRTALYIQTDGTSNSKDLLIRGFNGTSDVFTVSRMGGITANVVTSTGGVMANVNNSYDLGSPLAAWRNIYASGTSQLAYVSSTLITIGGKQLCLADGTNCGSSTSTLYAVTHNGNYTDLEIGVGGVSSTGMILTQGIYSTGTNIFANSSGIAVSATSTSNTAVQGASYSGIGVYGDSYNSYGGFFRSFNGGTGLLSKQGSTTDFLTATSSNPTIWAYRSGKLGVGQNDYTAPVLLVEDAVGWSGDLQNWKQGTTKLRVDNTGRLLPAVNNSLDLGSAALSWKDIYASGTSQLAYVSSTWITVGGKSLCLQDGTNCSSATSTLQAVTNNGNITTLAIGVGGVSSTGMILTQGIYSTGTNIFANSSGYAVNATSTSNFALYGSSYSSYGGYLRSVGGVGAIAVQGSDTSLNATSTNPTLWAYRSGVYDYPTHDYTGPVLMVEDNRAWSGDLQNWKKQGVIKLRVDNTGTLLPAVTNSLDLGSASLSWKDIYASGTSRLAYVSSTWITVGGKSLCLQDGTNCGSATSTLQAVTNNGNITTLAIGVGGVSSTGHIYTTANNTYDLGSATTSWKDVYASGTAYLRTASISTGTNAVPSWFFTGDTDTGFSSPALGNLDINTDGSLRARISSGGFQVGPTLYATGNNLTDIGRADISWKNIYASGTSQLAYVSSTLITIGGKQLCLADGTNCGSSTSTLYAVTHNGNFTNLAIGVAGVSSTGNIIPTVANTYDLGSTTLPWKNVYASGTVIGNQFLAGRGTLAAPAFSFASETNTGMYSDPSYLYLAKSGSLIYAADASTYQYNYRTMLSGNNNAYDLGRNSGFAWHDIYASGTAFIAGVSSTGGLYPKTNNSYDLGGSDLAWRDIFANGTASLANVSSTNIYASGYVSTTNLYVSGGGSGNVFVQGGNSFGTAGTLGTKDANNLNLITNNTSRMTILSGGNVGIGTTAPNDKLSVATGITLGTLYSIVTGEITDTTTVGGMYAVHDTNTPNYGSGLAFQTYKPNVGLNESMRIDSSGNVGIGTAVPLSALHVSGTTALNWGAGIDSYGLVTLGTGGISGGSLFVNTPSLNASYQSGFGVDGSYSNPGGVGTSVINLKAFGVNSGGGYGSAIAFSTTNNTKLTEAMRIDKTGNVGIGATTPANKLTLTANGTLTSDADLGFNVTSTDGGTQSWTIGADKTDQGKFKISSSTV